MSRKARAARWTSWRACSFPGCGRGLATGHALYRVSPTGPGHRFEGRCREHMPAGWEPPENDVAGLVEARNLGRGPP
jgi:hypothetical protein